MFDGTNVIVLDLETLHSADDLPTGWSDKPALGLSIGCYYDYLDGRVHWFDQAFLVRIVQYLVDRQPLMISFNGIGFDFVVMCGLIRRQADEVEINDRAEMTRATELRRLCDLFKTLAANSYDLLAEIWASDPQGKFERGLNSLDAICAANELGEKIGHGAQAPKDWANQEYAKVLNYCQHDVYLTKNLAELVAMQQGKLLRSSGPLTIRFLKPRDDGTVGIAG